jgi:ABC-type sugar transport system permease subunit
MPTKNRTAPKPSRGVRSLSWLRFLLIPLVVILDIVAAIWVWSAFTSGLWLLGSVVVLIVIGVNFGVLKLRATALRWLLPTLAFMTAFAVAPIVYTAYISLTNYNAVHLLTEQQAVAALERQDFVPEGATPYDWAAYRAADGSFAVYLVPQIGEVIDSDTVDELTEAEDGAPDQEGGVTGEETTPDASVAPTTDASAPAATPAPSDTATPAPTDIPNSDLFARPGQEAEEAVPGEGAFGAADADGFPEEIDGYTRLNVVETVQAINELSATEFGAGDITYRVISSSQAAPIETLYEVDPDSGNALDRRTGIEYQRTSDGFFADAEGNRITPAFQTFVGLDNFVTLFTNERIRGPFLGILAWTITFSIVVVVVQFLLALLYAVVMNSRFVHPVVARVSRSIMLLPYVIPGYLLILTWASLFNVQVGFIPSTLESMFGLDPSWIETGPGARIAMLIVGIWLGFPYFLLINTGALQSIPGELLEAAAVDGASPWRRFRAIVFPLLMRTIAPLIVLAFAANFNNFYIAYFLFQGGPPLPNVQVPAGQTDLLISFTYKLSFGFGGNDYALAAVITSLIFVALTPIVLSQLRYYNTWRKED